MSLFSRKPTVEKMTGELKHLFSSYLIVRADQLGEEMVDGELFASLVAGYAFAMKYNCDASFTDIDIAHKKAIRQLMEDGALKQVVGLPE